MPFPSELPNEQAADFAISGEEVRDRVQLELAIHFLQLGLISTGRAAEMSGVSRGEFEGRLAERGWERSYAEGDWAEDLAWLDGRR
jgi:predicted HTH domain antitoxin